MFDKDIKDTRLKTTGILTLLNTQFYLAQMDLSNLEQLILVLNSLKREADALSNDGKGGSRVVISGFYLNDWIDDAMTIYNGALELIDVVSKEKK
nr:MAG TPA: hypothetical protein [Caudoviricetes sp.]